ncbi:unnamed protein product [Paramecium octaurelia]|uniref:Uncharacterized protein n=1 Tax=Paramecium octaurelia TaxID=43137 RepID=A0A8S1XK45_PAROT|nr:unnamed protein product [Paramecium octaurelia]
MLVNQSTGSESATTSVQKHQDYEHLKTTILQLEEEISGLRGQIKMWEEKYEEQERIHNREIVQLKCNLDNSIFEDQRCDENDLQVIQEETEFYQKSLCQSQVTQGRIETNNLMKILDQIDMDDAIDLQCDQEAFIVYKVTKIVEMIKKMELDLDDWKRNYWMLEKKLNQILLQQQDKLLKQGSEEIEIEFDFDKKKIITKNQETKSTKHTDEIQVLLDEIKRLKQLNAELIQQQKSMTKQMLEQLIVKQMKSDSKNRCLTQVSEPGVKQQPVIRNNNSQHYKQLNKSPNVEPRNHYFSQYFQAQQHHQQLSMRIQPQSNNLNAYQSNHSYEQPKTSTPTIYATPIMMKYANGSPFNHTNKILQF